MARDPTNADRPPVERRGWTIFEFAERWGVSPSTIKRGVSHQLLKPVYVGDRPILTAEDDERMAAGALSDLPPGYKRRTAGPTKVGRPLGSTKAKLAAKAVPAAAKPVTPAKGRERERRPTA